MKITTFILFAALMQVSAAGLAQRLTLPKQDISLKQLFNEINKQTGYVMVWSASTVNADQRVIVDFKDTPLLEVLDKSLQHTNLSYSIENKTVVIKEKEPSLFDKVKSALGVPITISGKVYDETGQPMPGVTVKQKDNPSNGVVTDANGSFTITVADNNSIITFSFIGYEKQELAAKDIPNGSRITLKAAPENLKEVVINKGYYNERRELSTGDVGSVSAKEIQEQPVTDPILALEGRVAGLEIQQASGIPGAYSSIRIRGQNSIGNGNDPLYIVDGVPYGSASLSSAYFSTSLGQPYSSVSNGTGNPVANAGLGANGGGGMSPFNSLNPSDIENIEVLKDADATAIYGSRGANGVILITTKKGKAGKTQVDVNMQQGWGKVTRMIDLLNTQQYLTMRREAFNNDGLPVPNINTDPTNTDYDINGVWNTSSYTNWQKVLIGNTAKYTNVQGSLSGGTANTQFVISGGYNGQGTVYPGNYLDQHASAHFNLTHSSPDQRFHALFTANYGYGSSDLPYVDFTQNITLAPDAPAPYNKDGSLNWQLLNGTPTWQNPLASTFKQAKAITTDLISNLSLDYELLKGLTLKSSFGYNQGQMDQKSLQPSTSIAPPDNNDPNNRGFAYATTEIRTWIIEPQLDYKVTISKGKLDALVGGTLQENFSNSLSEVAYGFSDDALITDPAAASNIQILGQDYSAYHYEAIYGRLGYNWEEKYLLNLTARRDGSSRFGPGKQFGNFGAIGAGWIFSKESFFKDLSFISFGKLRMSYGTTGNDQITPYQYLSSYNPQSSTYLGVAGLSPARIPNPYFSWETNKKLEGGLDIGLMKDRIDFSVNYYRNRSSNQLVAYTLPQLTGFSAVEANFPATVQNTGLEFSLTTTNIKTQNFTWTTSANVTIPRNKLVAFPNLATSPYSYLAIGQPLTIHKAFYSAGVDAQTGLYSFQTANASGIPSYPADAVYQNAITQNFYGGIQNSFSYRQFQLDVFIQFTKQNAFNYQDSFAPPGEFDINEPTIVLGRWQKPGDNTGIEKFTQDPGSASAQAYGALTGAPGSNLAITDASFIRLKNIALSYQLPTEWDRKMGVQHARFYLNAQNLLTITKYQVLDPETGGLNLPPLRMITIGLQVGL